MTHSAQNVGSMPSSYTMPIGEHGAAQPPPQPEEQTMPAEIGAMYERLVTLNRQAFEGSHYDVAYHALMAALHCAQEARDADRLAAVEVTATEQLAWIDAQASAYRHSTASADARHHHVSIFTTLARQARARQRMVRGEPVEPERDEPIARTLHQRLVPRGAQCPHARVAGRHARADSRQAGATAVGDGELDAAGA